MEFDKEIFDTREEIKQERVQIHARIESELKSLHVRFQEVSEQLELVKSYIGLVERKQDRLVQWVEDVVPIFGTPTNAQDSFQLTEGVINLMSGSIATIITEYLFTREDDESNFNERATRVLRSVIVEIGGISREQLTDALTIIYNDSIDRIQSDLEGDEKNLESKKLRMRERILDFENCAKALISLRDIV